MIDIIGLNMKIQICLTVLVVVCFTLSVYCAKKDYSKSCTVSFVMSACFAVLSMWRLQCFVGGGYLYGNAEANTVANSLFIYRDNEHLGNRLYSDKFVSRFINNEELKDLNSLDRVEFYLKYDLSRVKFFDVLLCRDGKWLDYKVVGSSKYIIFSGKDAEIVSKTSVGYLNGNTRYYLRYNGKLYSLSKENTENSLFEGVLRKGLLKEDSYMLVYDSLGIGEVELDGKSEEYYKIGMLRKLKEG